MPYIENPKTKNSGIICAIPQKGKCSNNCEDCFYNEGRSYVEPLEENTPNMPSLKQTKDKIVRINDGHDSNIDRTLVEKSTELYKDKFYNTSMPWDISGFNSPVVFTCNPGKMTDKTFYKIDPIPINLMFVRVRVNTWNIKKVIFPAVKYYTKHKIPVVLTFMAYYKIADSIPEADRETCYIYKKRTLNSYWCIRPEIKQTIEYYNFHDNPYVYSCGYKDTHACVRCGNCLREYYATKERMENV